jgi:hypothetical protein
VAASDTSYWIKRGSFVPKKGRKSQSSAVPPNLDKHIPLKPVNAWPRLVFPGARGVGFGPAWRRHLSAFGCHSLLPAAGLTRSLHRMSIIMLQCRLEINGTSFHCPAFHPQAKCNMVRLATTAQMKQTAASLEETEARGRSNLGLWPERLVSYLREPSLGRQL